MRQSITRGASATALVDYILDRPGLLQAVRALPPRALKKLIDHVGLEAAGELVALASSEQLQRVFDDDLWLSEQAGRDERFDAQRFALWLEVLVEQGAAFAARTLGALDADLLTLALCNLLLVIDVDQLAQTMSVGAGEREDREQLEKLLESGLYHEFEQYRVIARDARAWDALLAVLCEWNEQDYATFERTLERCCAVSNDYIEDNGGLYEVLTGEELLEQDVAAERADRRAADGYLAPSDARAFLRLARETPFAELVAQQAPDPITRGYFRALSGPLPAPRSAARRALPADGASAPELTELLAALRVASASAEAPRQKLAAGAVRAPAPRLLAALRRLAVSHPALHAQRLQEAAYLANALLAGVGMRAVEAAEAALWLCELGAQQLPADGARSAAGLHRLLAQNSLVKLLQLGFRHLTQLESATPPLAALHARLVAQGWTKPQPPSNRRAR